MSERVPTLEEKFRVFGLCGCKDRCAREQGEETPRRYGVCEAQAQDAGLVPYREPEAEEET